MTEKFTEPAPLTLDDILADGQPHQIMSHPIIKQHSQNIFWISSEPGIVTTYPPLTDGDCYRVDFSARGAEQYPGLAEVHLAGSATNLTDNREVEIIHHLKMGLAFIRRVGRVDPITE